MTLLEKRIARAKRMMGEKYLCHPANHVKRLAQPLDETDISRHMRKQDAPVIILDDRRKA